MLFGFLTALIRKPPAALLPLAGALLLLALLAAAFALAAPATADAQSAKPLGKTPRIPDPACPTNTRQDPCEAVGSVTGFQIAGQGRRGLMRVRENGWLLAWTIKLSRPNRQQRDFFGDFYAHETWGEAPQARIAILRPRGNGRFELMRHSPVVELTPELGTTHTFTLNRPLRITQGLILALTVPTWSPSFAVNLPADGNRWRASRHPDRCTGTGNIRSGNPHMAENTERRYGCVYRTARLLYWGHYIAD